MRLSKILLAAQCLAAGVMVSASQAMACSCAPVTRAEAVANATIVVNGRVERVWTQGRKRLVSVRVLRVEKGRSPLRLVIETPLDSAACGVNFKRGDVGDIPVKFDRLRRIVTLCPWMAMQTR